MRLHTKLSYSQVVGALADAKDEGHIAHDVTFVGYTGYKSRTHERAHEIQLGTWDKTSLPAGYTDQHGHKLTVRRYKNTGDAGASSEWFGHDGAVWSATYHEWGWLMAKVYELDPEAVWGSQRWGYQSAADFHAKTKGVFDTHSMTFPKGHSV
jgi:hypothetical protein